MKRIWAPWRLEYVAADEADAGCFLCRALEGDDDRDSLLVHRGRSCAVILNRYPYNNGHLMIFPHRHVSEVARLTPGERLEMMDLLATCLDVLREAMAPAGFNAGYNLGRIAGAGLDEHLHQHVVPRWSGDTNYMPVIADTRVIPESLGALWDRLRPLFAGAAPGG
jgi:ATP adenylyltransferase